MTSAYDTHQKGPQYHEPAGLEVVPAPEPGLEYCDPAYDKQHVHNSGGPSYGGGASFKTGDGGSAQTTEAGRGATSRGCLPKTRRQRVIWLVAGILPAAVVAGAAVGGVLASKRGSKTTTGTTGSSPANSTASPTPPNSIRLNSRLAASAFRKVNGVEIYLFFHGPDNVVYRATYDSALGTSVANSSALWQPPVAATVKPAPNSPIWSSIIVWDSLYQVRLPLLTLAWEKCQGLASSMG
jgi:hypothetical protein